MIEGRNIICIASNWWYDPTSKHHIMRILSERNHVIWVNYHGSRRPRVGAADARAIAGKLRQVVQGPRHVSTNMTVVTPLVVPLPGSRAAANLNRGLLVRQIRSVLRELPDRPVQLWTFAPDVDFLVGLFREERSVYYCVDEFDAFCGYDGDAIRGAEARLAKKVDLVVTTSAALEENKRALNPNTHLVMHGVDFDCFAKATVPGIAIPADIAGLPRPVLGFWGLIQDWVDVELLAAAARLRANASFVFIGEVQADVSPLASQPNVHFLGRRPYAELPAYARGFDVGLIPFRVNQLTRAVNPIKLREYLSAGLPVVATRLPEVERYRPWVEIADTPHSFACACDRAGRSRCPEQDRSRQAAMRAESWPVKVERISELVLAAGAKTRRSGLPHQSHC